MPYTSFEGIVNGVSKQTLAVTPPDTSDGRGWRQGSAWALLAAPNFVGLAHAFTLEGQTITNSGGGANYSAPATDPKALVDSTGTGTTLQQGNTTFQFGGQGQSSGERFNADANRMFNPLGRPGESR